MHFNRIFFVFLVIYFILLNSKLLSQNTSPQYSDNQIYQYDSIKYSSFINGSWKLGVITKKFQDPLGRLVLETYDVNIDSSLTIREKDIYAINSSGLPDTIYSLSNGGTPGNPLDTVAYRLLQFNSKNKLLSDTSFLNNNGIWELRGIDLYTYDSMNRIIFYSTFTASQNSKINITTFSNSPSLKMDSVILITPVDTIFWGIDNREYLPDGRVSKYFYVSSNMDTTTSTTFFYINQNVLDSVFINSSFPFAFKYNYDSAGIIKEFIRYTENNSVFSKSSLEEYFNFREISGISFLRNHPILKVFPNPTKGVLHFAIENSASNEYQIDIFNINGLKIKSEKGSSAQPSININELNFGIYIYELNLNRETYRGKIIHE